MENVVILSLLGIVAVATEWWLQHTKRNKTAR
jgi:hypothetical protein